MPLYEYLCEACGRTSEVLRRFDDPPLESCPHCGGKVKKQMSAPAFHLKGSGWYATDYAKKSGGDASKSSAPAAAGESAAGSSDSATSAESATAAKPEAKSEAKGGESKGNESKGGDTKS